MTYDELTQLPSDKWLEVSIPYFRKLGFFAKSNLTDEELVQQIKEAHGEPFVPKRATMDIGLLNHDPDAHWDEDMEDRGEIAGFYTEMLQNLGRISRGAFVPTEISEDFGYPDRPTKLEFEYRGQLHTVIADNTEDSPWGVWIDLRLLDQLNSVIEKTGRQFAIFRSPFQDISVFCLTKAEMASLRADRGWRFMDDVDEEADEDLARRFGLL